MWKRGEIAPIFLTSGVKLHIHLLNVVVQFIILLTLSTLICRGTDISKCFSESLGIRDNESRLYLTCHINYLFLSRKRTFWHGHPTDTETSLCIRVVWSESSLSACRNFAEDPDKMLRLFWIFNGHFLTLTFICICQSLLSRKIKKEIKLSPAIQAQSTRYLNFAYLE